MLPRVHRPDQAKLRFGASFDAIVPWLEREDPLADALAAAMARGELPGGFSAVEAALQGGPLARAPDALKALLDEASTPPAWLCVRRRERGGAALFRAGPLGGLVLGVKSLVHGYASPAGNKPLVLSGQLKARAARRLSETGRFVQAVCEPEGMEPGHEGFVVALKVRLIHARVRLLCRQGGAWRDEVWGAPINQHDMMATLLLFSAVLLEGLERLGLKTPPALAEDYLHLWSHVGHVMGVDRTLLPLDAQWARTLWDLIESTQGPPDDDARALVSVLLAGPVGDLSGASLSLAVRVGFAQGLARVLLGDELADGLAVPSHGWRHVVPLLRPLLGSLEAMLLLPSGERLARRLGRRYWARLVREGLAGDPARFAPPAALEGQAPP
jgi:hypothetical protein